MFFFLQILSLGFFTSNPPRTCSQGLASAFSDPRMDLHFMDAAAFIKDKQGEFDVIIVDSSDPIGPAATLYTSEFYKDMRSALQPGGIICTQGECQWLHLEFIGKVLKVPFVFVYLLVGVGWVGFGFGFGFGFFDVVVEFLSTATQPHNNHKDAKFPCA